MKVALHDGLACWTAVFAAATGLYAQCPDWRVVYVDSRAEGADDGSNWANAYRELGDALAEADACSRIWVATGVYRPGPTRASAFLLRDDIEIYGGLAGTENPQTFDPASRDLQDNETILDGNIGQAVPTDNTYHVVRAEGVTRTAMLDGFTITGGHADGLTSARQDVGAGMLIVDASPTIRRCVFRANRAGTRGAAVHNTAGSPLLESCRFVENVTTATQPGSNMGGAVYSTGGEGLAAFPILINCLFIDNRAGVGAGGSGGALYNAVASRAVLTNCTIINNIADDHGGGIFGSVTLTNSILWNNRDSGGTDQSAQLYGGLPIVSHNCIQGWTDDDQAGNIGDDPQFSVEDGVGLGPSSPCLDAGDSNVDTNPLATGLQALPLTDLAGLARIANGTVDIGAFERPVPCDVDADCDDGDPCTIDSCELSTQQCLRIRLACDDGLYCNGVEVCEKGACMPGISPECDDGVPCTLDSCDEEQDACKNVRDDSYCDDGVYCNGIERCDALAGCVADDVVVCDDGMACTADSCDEAAGACRYDPNNSRCDDGQFCNGVESCSVSGGCQPGNAPCEAPLMCDDAVDACAECIADGDCGGATPCMISTCDLGVCVATNVSDGTPCADDLFCNGQEVCLSGVCTPSSSPCASGETCDESQNVCRPPPQCQTHAECDNGNVCTDDSCDAGTCRSAPNAIPCDDGDICTENDACSNAVCAGTAIAGCENSDVPDDGAPDGPADNSATILIDADEDGVDDALDLCPNTPAGMNANADGCACVERDTDGDGTNDCDDICPEDDAKTDPGLCGCGSADVDEDSDGVVDCEDLCLNTPRGQVVDADGCPVDDAAPQTVPTDSQPLSSSACGTCGAFGMVTWFFLVLGWVGLRIRSFHIRGGHTSADSPAAE